MTARGDVIGTGAAAFPCSLPVPNDCLEAGGTNSQDAAGGRSLRSARAF